MRQKHKNKHLCASVVVGHACCDLTVLWYDLVKFCPIQRFTLVSAAKSGSVWSRLVERWERWNVCGEGVSKVEFQTLSPGKSD